MDAALEVAVETDKAAMEMEACDEGVLTRIQVAEGASVPIGTPIAVIGEAVAEAAAPPARVVREDQVAIATTMTLTLSVDHRAVDGATAAGFLARLTELIEQPLDIVL